MRILGAEIDYAQATKRLLAGLGKEPWPTRVLKWDIETRYGAALKRDLPRGVCYEDRVDRLTARLIQQWRLTGAIQKTTSLNGRRAWIRTKGN